MDALSGARLSLDGLSIGDALQAGRAHTSPPIQVVPMHEAMPTG
jgi:hypothetical protein